MTRTRDAGGHQKTLRSGAQELLQPLPADKFGSILQIIPDFERSTVDCPYWYVRVTGCMERTLGAVQVRVTPVRCFKTQYLYPYFQAPVALPRRVVYRRMRPHAAGRSEAAVPRGT